jgi:hypothetical protein
MRIIHLNHVNSNLQISHHRSPYRLERLAKSSELPSVTGCRRSARARSLQSTDSFGSQDFGNMAELMFVNLSDPTQNKRRGVRKLVRSHVSYIQHSQKRIELGHVKKQDKSQYTDRSVNGWALLDDSRAGQLSPLKANEASGVDSGLLSERQATLPGSGPIRCPRQPYNKELTAAGVCRRRPRQNQCQPRTLPTPPTPILDGEVHAKKDSPQAVSRLLPTMESETVVTSTDGVLTKQEPGYETEYKWDIVSQYRSRRQRLSSSSTSGWGCEGDEPSSTSFHPLYSSLDDPTDEVRIWIERLRISLPSVMVSLL